MPLDNRSSKGAGHERLDHIARRNKETETRIAALRQPGASPMLHAELRLLQRDNPWYGLLPCRAAGLDFVMFHANDDQVSREYLWEGEDGYEPELTTVWVDWCRQRGTYLDIGGYSGLMSVLAARANSANEVHLFEAVERTIERASINMKLNGIARRVTLHNVAASDRTGSATIHLYRQENVVGSGNSIDLKSHVPAVAERTIATVAIDTHLPGITPNAVKIDVEGHELAVLQGMRETIRRARPKMLLEVWTRTRNEVFAFLDEHRYSYRLSGPLGVNCGNYIVEPR